MPIKRIFVLGPELNYFQRFYFIQEDLEIYFSLTVAVNNLEHIAKHEKLKQTTKQK